MPVSSLDLKLALFQHQHQRGAPEAAVGQGRGHPEPAEPAAKPAAGIKHPKTTIDFDSCFTQVAFNLRDPK